MQIIISPAKRMYEHIDFAQAQSRPRYRKNTAELVRHIRSMSEDDIAKMLQCNAQIAAWTKQAYARLNLQAQGIPALLAYDGIQYRYMRPDLFTDEALQYAKNHVLLLSGLYGILRTMDGIQPYRLELDNRFHTDFCTSLYDFWRDDLYRALTQEDHEILDLCSRQYGKIVHRYREESVHIVTCYFCEEEDGNLREKGVYVKMARGEMVRWLCENNIQTFAEVKKFTALGYRFHETYSDDDHYIFTRRKVKKCGVTEKKVD